MFSASDTYQCITVGSLFKRLPREIRNQIYLHVLAPTGCFLLHSTDVVDLTTRFTIHACDQNWIYYAVDEIDLRLLRTCKKVYEECAGLLWEKNTLHIDEGNGPLPGGISYSKPFTKFPFDQLRHVVVKCHGWNKRITPCYDTLGKILHAVAWQPQPNIISELMTLTVKLRLKVGNVLS